MFATKENPIALPTSPVLRASRRPQYVREGVCLLVALTILGQLLLARQYCSRDFLITSRFQDHSANSTLGFGSIYAVSKPGSPRQQPLINAAKLTSLNITIPLQPRWSEQDITDLQTPGNSALDRGSALAWLGHRNVLSEFLKTRHDTALILEDDVDWDTQLRSKQIPQTAYAIRELLGSHGNGYYGSLESWDIIWLGHCGDFFNATRGSDIPVIKSFIDSAMPKLEELHPWTRDFLRGIGAVKDQQRLVHNSVQPLCTFAYAITRPAAERVLNELAAREPLRNLGNPCKAYDVRLLESCRDEGLKCITVNPELFHHSDLGSEIAQVTDNLGSTQPISVQEDMTELPTTNIRCSARSGRWQEIRDSITDSSIDAESLVKELAELSSECYIDDFLPHDLA